MWFRAGCRVTVSLVDGSVLAGVTLWAWPGRLRLAEVEVSQGAVPGVVLVPARSILIVQVL